MADVLATFESGRERILLAEDNPAMCVAAARLLDAEFEVVGTVRDGRALLEAAREMKPDVVVVDISMPVINGLAAARQLKDSGSQARVVVLTVHTEGDFVRDAFASGAVGYVVKPRMAADLVPAVKEALSGRSFVSPGLDVS